MNRTVIDDWMEGVSRVCITGHKRPDGDCLGSTLALFSYLNANYEVQADIFMEEYSAPLRELPGTGHINPDVPEDVSYDIFFSLDTSTPDRIGQGAERRAHSGRTIVIDHHVSNPGYGDVNVIHPDVSSACEVLFTLLDVERLTREAAICLYTGMAHDTGIFQYAAVTPDTLRRAATLMSFGFDFSGLITRTWYARTLSAQKLLALALSRASITPWDQKGIWSYVTLADMEQVGSCPMEADGIVETLRCTEGIDYSCFAYETADGEFRGSFRSRGETNVNEIASAFGGGGHKLAAGCTFTGLGDPQSIFSAVGKVFREKNNG